MSDTAARPAALDVQPAAIPAALGERAQWVAWRYQHDSDRDEWTKIPVDVDSGGYASSTDPETWAPFDDACAYHARDDVSTDGIGFVVTDDDPIVGVDLDDCRDPTTGDLAPWAAALVAALPTYAEVSPSGTGVRLFGVGTLPDGGTRADIPNAEGHLEMYTTGRYLTVTGHVFDETPCDIHSVADELHAIHAEYIASDDRADDDSATADNPTVGSDGALRAAGTDHAPAGESLSDEAVLDCARNAKTGDEFRALWRGDWKSVPGRDYPSHSEARYRLISDLAFYTQGDRDQMRRLFERSPLAQQHPEDSLRDFDNHAAAKILAEMTEFYDPGGGADVGPLETAPAAQVDAPLIDALRDAPAEWLDPDAKAWTVQTTDDFAAETIAAALQAGTLPEAADTALAEATFDGDFPEEIEAALRDWRDAPAGWRVDVARTFDEDALEPAAIAFAADVEPDMLGTLPASELAHHVWERIQARDDHHIVARVGERADGSLFSYDRDAGIWRETGDTDLRTLANQALGAAYSKRVGDELAERVRLTPAPGEPVGQVSVDAFGAPAETIPVANGLLDVHDREIRPLIPADYALATLPVAFDPDAECPTFEAFLRDVCPRSVDRKKLQEYVGYTLMHWALPYHKALFLAGPQASGKSTFLTVVHRLLGDETTCSLAPQEITGERFAGYDLWGARANIRSDIPAELIQNTGKFKEVTAGDPVKIEQKYHDPVTIEPTAKHLFAANTLPTAEIDDDAFFRRILLVSFPDTIPRTERDPHLEDTLADELPGILNWALDGLERLREQEHFSGDLPPAETHAKWRAWGESIPRFLHQCVDLDAAATATIPKHMLYQIYRQFCTAEGVPAESNAKFGREVMNTAGVGERQQGTRDDRQWVYTGIDLLPERVPAERDDDQCGLEDTP